MWEIKSKKGKGHSSDVTGLSKMLKGQDRYLEEAEGGVEGSQRPRLLKEVSCDAKPGACNAR